MGPILGCKHPAIIFCHSFASLPFPPLLCSSNSLQCQLLP